MSPLLMYDRNGPPCARLCPVVVCDFCGHPIQGDQRSPERGHVIWWQRYDGPGNAPTCSPLHFTHARCDRKQHGEYTPANGWLNYWDTLGEFLDQLRHNLVHPFAEDPDGEFVKPRLHRAEVD